MIKKRTKKSLRRPPASLPPATSYFPCPAGLLRLDRREARPERGAAGLKRGRGGAPPVRCVAGVGAGRRRPDVGQGRGRDAAGPTKGRAGAGRSVVGPTKGIGGAGRRRPGARQGAGVAGLARCREGRARALGRRTGWTPARISSVWSWAAANSGSAGLGRWEGHAGVLSVLGVDVPAEVGLQNKDCLTGGPAWVPWPVGPTDQFLILCL
jgi:hypothetical protein